MRGVCLAFLLALTGCSHRLAIMGHDGTAGTGTASMGIGAGTVAFIIADEAYRGTWTAAENGSNSVGLMLAQSDRGGRLRCRFTYGGWTDAGYGTCKDAAGKEYDMQIR